MSSTTKYKNVLKTNITLHQAKNSDSYYLYNYENEALKNIISVNKYGESEEKGIWYYMGPEEIKSEVLQSLKQQNIYQYFILFHNKQTAYNVDLWDFEEYNEDMSLVGKGKTAYDSKHRTVMSCELGLQTSEPEGNSIVKKYYSNQLDGEWEDLLIEVKFYENGNVEWIYDRNENFGYSEPISLSEFLSDEEFSQQDFPWNQHPYYHSLYPFLPEGPL